MRIEAHDYQGNLIASVELDPNAIPESMLLGHCARCGVRLTPLTSRAGWATELCVGCEAIVNGVELKEAM
jgi:hypothetical protein